MYQRPISTQIFADITQALLNQRPLDIEYHSRSRDERSQRIIDPQRLMFYRSNWYLLAWCRDGEGLRTFALDRVLKICELEQKILKIDDEQLDSYCLEGFGLWRGFDVETAVLRFKGPDLAYVADEVWHPQQKAQWEGDDYILSLPFSNPDELILEILRHGPGVQVLEPLWLREQIVSMLEDSLKAYKS
jgi:predicted DNA-binding transcriptional regulator YafY